LNESKKKKGFYDVVYKPKEDAIEVLGEIVGDWLSYMYFKDQE
jgi:hypothetical protein